jgi:hypothetical protein
VPFASWMSCSTRESVISGWLGSIKETARTGGANGPVVTKLPGPTP